MAHPMLRRCASPRSGEPASGGEPASPADTITPMAGNQRLLGVDGLDRGWRGCPAWSAGTPTIQRVSLVYRNRSRPRARYRSPLTSPRSYLRRVFLSEQLSSAVPAQLARRCLRQGSGGEQPYLARGVPNLVVHPGCDVAADTQAHVLLVRVMHFGEHREALPLGVDPQRDHAALAHTVDGRGRTLDIVRIQVLPGHAR